MNAFVLCIFPILSCCKGVIETTFFMNSILVSIPFKDDPRTGSYNFFNQSTQFSLFSKVPEFPKEPISQKSITIGNRTVLLEEIKDIAIVSGKEVEFHYFQLSHKSDSKYIRNSVAFPFKFTDEKYSFIHQLKKNNVIDKLEYTIFEGLHDMGKLYIGGLNESLVQNHSESFCKVDKDEIGWSCRLSKVMVLNEKNDTYTNSARVFFQGNNRMTYVPRSFFKFLDETVLRIGKKESTCKRIGLNEQTVECDCFSINLFPSLIFFFDEAQLEFSMVDLFNHFIDVFVEEEECTFYITENRMGDFWEIGSPFFNHFVTTFDYENEEIRFYSRSNRTYMSADVRKKKMKFIFLVDEIVIFFGLFLLVVARRHQKSF